MTDDLATLFNFDQWANTRIFDACRQVPEIDYKREPTPGWGSLHATLVHIAGATHVWARRFEGETVTSLPAEADFPGIEDAWRLLEDAHRRIAVVLQNTDRDGLNAIRSFKNLKGEPRSMPFWAALRHVVNHATYHRGQIGSKLKRLGFDPPVTDLAAWAFENTEQSA